MTVPAMVPDQTRRCGICPRYANEAHHILHRSQGGDDHEHNLIDLCRDCHDKLHPEKQGGYGWQIIRTDDVLYVIDRQTGEQIAERHHSPTFEQGAYIEALDGLADALGETMALVRFLDDDGLSAAWGATKHFGKGIWLFQAELLYWAVRHVPYGDKTEKLKAVAREMGFKSSKGYELLQLREALPDLSARAEHLVTEKPSLLREAVRSPEPERAFEQLEEAIAENQDVTVKAFRERLKGTDLAVEWHLCPDCGANHPRRAE